MKWIGSGLEGERFRVRRRMVQGKEEMGVKLEGEWFRVRRRIVDSQT